MKGECAIDSESSGLLSIIFKKTERLILSFSGILFSLSGIAYDQHASPSLRTAGAKLAHYRFCISGAKVWTSLQPISGGGAELTCRYNLPREV